MLGQLTKKVRGIALMAVALGVVAIMASAQQFENLLTKDSLLGIVCAVRDGLFPMFLTLAVIAFLAAGALYLIAQGDVSKVTRAKKALIYGAIGTVAAILSLGAAFIVAEIFGIDPGTVC